MSKGASSELRELHYTGLVQGVGFRMITHQIASGLAVSGYVTNLPDGRVKLVAEGGPAELDEFQRQIEQQLGSQIRAVARDTRPATGEYASFEIRY